MTGHTDITQIRNSLNWLAVQYVLGELPESEMFAFEERLAFDSAACEAVAAATRLTLTLHSAVADAVTMAPASAATPAARTSKGTPRGSWLALAGATTAAASLLAAMSLEPNGTHHEPLARADRSASELVSLWRTGSSALDTDADESDVEVDESNREVAVPNWLFAAVSLEQSKAAGNFNDERQEN